MSSRSLNKAFRSRRGSATERPLSTIQLLSPDLDDELEPIFHLLKRKYSLDYDGYERNEQQREGEIADESVRREEAEEEIIDPGEEWRRIGDLLNATAADSVDNNRVCEEQQQETDKRGENSEACGNETLGSRDNENRLFSLTRVEEEGREEDERGQEKGGKAGTQEKFKVTSTSEATDKEMDDNSGKQLTVTDGTKSQADENANSEVKSTPKKHSSVRPKSWLLACSDRNVEEGRRLRRRQTEPMTKRYHSDYEEALSSLLWQPYECRNEVANCSINADDSDVAYWLNSDTGNQKLNSRCSYQNCSSSGSSRSSESSMSASSSSSSVLIDGDFVSRLKENKPSWCEGMKEPSTSSLYGLLSNGENNNNIWGKSINKIGNTEETEANGEISDLKTISSGCLPVGALSTTAQTGWESFSSQLESNRGAGRLCNGVLFDKMLVNIESASENNNGGSQSNLLVQQSSTVGIVSAIVRNASVGENINNNNNNNSGVSVVNCYRAIPASVSSVPTIPCNNNVSNVRIVQTNNNNNSGGDFNARIGGRTFTSTEAQTDDVVVDPIRPSTTTTTTPTTTTNNREQRRRERRERRHQRRSHAHNQTHAEAQAPPPPSLWQTQVMNEPLADRLPDILNSHLPPPYSTLPMGLPPPNPGHIHLPPPPPPVPVPVLPPPIAVTAAPGSPPPPQNVAGGFRFPFAIVPPGRRR